MKYILTIVLGCLIYSAQGQQPKITGWSQGGIYLLPTEPCGTWECQPEQITEWQTVDTLGEKSHLVGLGINASAAWVYDDERPYRDEFAYDDLVWRPCGAEPSQSYVQYRVDINSGIRQQRRRTIPYKYLPHQKSPYERAVDSLTPAPPPSWRSDTLKCCDSLSTFWPHGFRSGFVDSAVYAGFSVDTTVWMRRRAPKKKRRKG